MSGYTAEKMLSNTAKYMINDAFASLEGKKLVIEAEYCQGVSIGKQRDVDPSLYTVIGNKQATYDKAIELGAHAHLGWTRDILPTFDDNAFDAVYMDYCCSPQGNAKCRPIEEMPDVYRILKPGGKAMFTFCKRSATKGGKNMKIAKEHLNYTGFSWIDTIEYKVEGNQPMFVIICTKSWFEPFRAKHDQFTGEANADVTIPDIPFETWPHMCMCDMCGILYPDGVVCKRVEGQLYCKDCVIGSSKLRILASLKTRRTSQENKCNAFKKDIQEVEASLTTVPDILKYVIEQKLNDMRKDLTTAQSELAETESKIQSYTTPPANTQPAPKKKRKRVPETSPSPNKRRRAREAAIKSAIREFCLNTQETDLNKAHALYNSDKKYSDDHMDCDLTTFQPIWEATEDARQIIQDPRVIPIIIEEGALHIELSNSLSVVSVSNPTSPFYAGDVIVRLAGEDVRHMSMGTFAQKLKETPRPCTIDVLRI